MIETFVEKGCANDQIVQTNEVVLENNIILSIIWPPTLDDSFVDSDAEQVAFPCVVPSFCCFVHTKFVLLQLEDESFNCSLHNEFFIDAIELEWLGRGLLA